MTTVLVAARSDVVRAGLSSLINASAGFTLAGDARGISIHGVARQLDELQPEVLLVELSVHEEEEALIVLLEGEGEKPFSPLIVALADEARDGWAAEALRAGVRAILPRGATADEIMAALTAAAEGLIVLRPETMASLLTNSHGAPHDLSAADGQEPLTPREREVFAMIAEGLGNKTIAFRLNISEHTVKFHVGSIFSKLGASSRTEAVTLGIRRGLLML